MMAGTAIVHVLGGARVLGLESGSRAEWGSLILEGIPVRSADALQQTMALTDAMLAQLLGVSEADLAETRAGAGRLGPLASHRLFRLARIVALAILTLGTERAAVHWLMHPQVELGVQAPVALLVTQTGRDMLERLLQKLGRDACSRSAAAPSRPASNDRRPLRSYPSSPPGSRIPNAHPIAGSPTTV